MKLKKTHHLIRGTQAETSALNFLLKFQLKHIQSNYRCRMGELDLIMLDKNTLVFVEVRYREKGRHGSAAESITPSKQKKLIRAALYFLQQNPRYQPYNCRFDVIAIDQLRGKQQINWIKNAFYHQ